MTPITTYRAFTDARKTLGPCAAYRVAAGRASPAPLQLFTTPRRRRHLLRSVRTACLGMTVFAVAGFTAGVITAFLPAPF